MVSGALADGGGDQLGHIRVLRPDCDLHGHAVGQGELGSDQDLKTAAENALKKRTLSLIPILNPLWINNTYPAALGPIPSLPKIFDVAVVN